MALSAVALCLAAGWVSPADAQTNATPPDTLQPCASGVAAGEYVSDTTVCPWFVTYRKDSYVNKWMTSHLGVHANQMRSVAVLISVDINAYDTTKTVTSALNDMKKLRDVLEKDQKFDEILVISSEKATRSNIMAALSYVENRNEERKYLKTRALIAYSGHGLRIRNIETSKPNNPSGAPKTLYLSTYDFANNRDKKRLISVGDFMSKLHDVSNNVSQVLVVVNACFGGALMEKEQGSSQSSTSSIDTLELVMPPADVPAPEFKDVAGGSAAGTPEPAPTEAWTENSSLLFSIFIRALEDGPILVPHAQAPTTIIVPGAYRTTGGGVGAGTLQAPANEETTPGPAIKADALAQQAQADGAVKPFGVSDPSDTDIYPMGDVYRQMKAKMPEGESCIQATNAAVAQGHADSTNLATRDGTEMCSFDHTTLKTDASPVRSGEYFFLIPPSKSTGKGPSSYGTAPAVVSESPVGGKQSDATQGEGEGAAVNVAFVDSEISAARLFVRDKRPDIVLVNVLGLDAFPEQSFSSNWQRLQLLGSKTGAYFSFTPCYPAQFQFNKLRKTFPRDAGGHPIVISGDRLVSLYRREGQVCSGLVTREQAASEMVKLTGLIEAYYGVVPSLTDVPKDFADTALKGYSHLLTSQNP